MAAGDLGDLQQYKSLYLFYAPIAFLALQKEEAWPRDRFRVWRRETPISNNLAPRRYLSCTEVIFLDIDELIEEKFFDRPLLTASHHDCPCTLLTCLVQVHSVMAPMNTYRPT